MDIKAGINRSFNPGLFPAAYFAAPFIDKPRIIKREAYPINFRRIELETVLKRFSTMIDHPR
jgi:hypothetical protein